VGVCVGFVSCFLDVFFCGVCSMCVGACVVFDGVCVVCLCVCVCMCVCGVCVVCECRL
jgi:hypothetical protein